MLVSPCANVRYTPKKCIALNCIFDSSIYFQWRNDLTWDIYLIRYSRNSVQLCNKEAFYLSCYADEVRSTEI